MRSKFVSNVKEMQSQESITIDESTVPVCAYLTTYARCDVSGKGDVNNVFLDIVELTDGVDAEHKAGMDDEFLKTHLIRIATDGAAVLTGKARLKQTFRLYTAWRTD